MHQKRLLSGTRRITLAAMLIAITLFLGFTGWGFIPIGTPVIAATLFHIPVILAGILFGPDIALICGVIFGIFTSALGFPFYIVVPAKMFIGVVAYYVFVGLIQLVAKRTHRKGIELLVLPATLAGIAGSLTNTVCTLGLATVFRLFGETLEANLAVVYASIIQASIEAVAAAVICVAVVVALYPLKYIFTITSFVNYKKKEVME
ncbi:MAG: ECF transporter S component [Caldisericia bacterium]|nr:ECF transporter S component [Caldisericia bacterium]